MKVIFDGNYLYHRSFSVFATYYKDQDMSEVLSNLELQQVLIRKCVTDLCATVNKLRTVDEVIVVIDSRSWRYNHHANYKYKATKVAKDYQKEFEEVLNKFEALLRKRGLIVSRVPGTEGDDLLYMWSSYYETIEDEQVVIVSADADIRQLITEKISVLNSNSKNLKMYCTEDNEEYWNEYFDNFLEVQVVDPMFILIGKAILGDSGDNIPTIKKGFGEKSFEKFYQTLNTKIMQTFMNNSVNKLAEYLSKNFCKFTNELPLDTVTEAIKFNLQLAWLDIKVYQEFEGEEFVDSILDSIYTEMGSYSYNKSFSLENFYGMLLK